MDIPIISKKSKAVPLNSLLLGNGNILISFKNFIQKKLNALGNKLFKTKSRRSANIFDDEKIENWTRFI